MYMIEILVHTKPIDNAKRRSRYMTYRITTYQYVYLKAEESKTIMFWMIVFLHDLVYQYINRRRDTIRFVSVN